MLEVSVMQAGSLWLKKNNKVQRETVTHQVIKENTVRYWKKKTWFNLAQSSASFDQVTNMFALKLKI